MPKRRTPGIKRRLPGWLRRSFRGRRKPDPELDEGGVPVDPNKNKTLSGGAAAELEFDED